MEEIFVAVMGEFVSTSPPDTEFNSFRGDRVRKEQLYSTSYREFEVYGWQELDIRFVLGITAHNLR
jgi:hypothetical protein